MANFMNLFFLNHRKNVALFRKAGSARFSILVLWQKTVEWPKPAHLNENLIERFYTEILGHALWQSHKLHHIRPWFLGLPSNNAGMYGSHNWLASTHSCSMLWKSFSCTWAEEECSPKTCDLIQHVIFQQSFGQSDGLTYTPALPTLIPVLDRHLKADFACWNLL